MVTPFFSAVVLSGLAGFGAGHVIHVKSELVGENCTAAAKKAVHETRGQLLSVGLDKKTSLCVITLLVQTDGRPKKVTLRVAP